MSSNTLLDNSNEELMMCNVLKKSMSDENFDEIMIATGYWDLPGMAIILKELDSFLSRKNSKLQILIGKEPLVRTYQQKNPQTRDDFPKEYIEKEIRELDLKDEYQAVVELILNHCLDSEVDSKINIRIYGQGEKENFLHAKCYIFKGNGHALGIIGSSNFTQKGLEGNAELNYIETDYKCVAFKKDDECPNIKGHISWFEEKWRQSEPWNKIFLEEILKKSPIGKVVEKKLKEKEQTTTLSVELSPYHAYLKLLINQWGDVIDNAWKNNVESFIPDNIMKLDYQIEAVNQGFSIMKKHGGFILSDVVGLGKTIVGILTIKRFLLEADERPRNVLIVVPPAIKSSWESSINDFDKDADDKIANRITFITTGSIGKLLNNDDDDFETDVFEEDLESGDYGLIIIDESHKFRNSESQMYKQLDSVIANSQIQPYVMLISATPQNNRPADLKNQIFLFQREINNTTLDTIVGRLLNTYFVEKENQYKELIKRTNKFGKPKSKEELSNDNNKLIELSNDIREKVIEPLVIRRTRTDVVKYFDKDLKLQNITFPKVVGPTEIPYLMSGKLSKLFYDTIEFIAPTIDDMDLGVTVDKEGSLKYYRYRAIEFLINHEDRKLYEKRNLTVELTSQRLARIMQILLVKRLESSFAAFRISLKNLQRYCQNMIDMLYDDCIFICPDIDINSIMGEYKCTVKAERLKAYDEIRKKIDKKKGNNREFKRTDFSDKYILGLEADKQLIDELHLRWLEERYDPKLDKFKSLIDSTFFSDINNPRNPKQKKLVIFSEAIETVKELAESIENIGNHKVLAITSDNRVEKQEIIQANFDANYKGEKKNDYDIIITTDVLAEGINLHRSNIILNYDTPWNSTRLMQRMGRVNRIGSQEEFVHVYNFFPSDEGNVHIDLIHKAHTKLQSFHTLFGGDNQVFSHNEEVLVHNLKQHEFDDSETPFMKYIAELKEFREKYPETFVQLLNLSEGGYSAKEAEQKELLCHVKTKFKTGLFYSVNAELLVTEIPLLEIIKRMQCLDTEESLLPMSNNWNKQKEAAINEFRAFINRTTRNADLTKKTKEADSILRSKILGKYADKLSKETVDLLSIARSLVKNGDIQLINAIIDIDKKLGTLFDSEENRILFIEDFAARRLKNIKNDTSKRLHSEPEVVLSMELR
jgi:superfamily II DNA/RNA helicase